MSRLTIAAALIAWLPSAVFAASSKEIILAERAGNPHGVQIDQRDNNLSIEICDSACEVFSARRVRSENEVWDVVLLHRAFFNDRAAARSFRVKNASHVSSVMAAYAEKCAKFPQDATRATCIVKYLARRNRIDYSNVRYEGAMRCETEANLLAEAPPVSDQRRCEHKMRGR